MKALPFSQSQGINYEVTHNHLSQFLLAHDFHDSTIKCLERHCHPVQLLLGIQVQVTLHQRYIRIHLEGLLNGVCLLPHQLSHHHCIFHCKPWPLHPYTPWKSVVPLEELKKFSKRPGTIFLKEFKAIFSIVVCELELKYGVNYTEAFTFKQLAHYVHYEALDVYEQRSPKILGVFQIPNPAYATAITTASQVAL